MITCRLGFADPRLERRWQLKYAVDQAALDTAISLTTLLFPGVVSRTVSRAFGWCLLPFSSLEKCISIGDWVAGEASQYLPSAGRHSRSPLSSTLLAYVVLFGARPCAFCVLVSMQVTVGSSSSIRALLVVEPLRPALQLWQHFSGGTLAAGDAAWLVMYLAWAPLFLLLSHRCPSTWLRLRTRLVLAARLQRLLTGKRRRRPWESQSGEL
jgi:hypothetical protein